jgi:glycine oxidase
MFPLRTMVDGIAVSGIQDQPSAGRAANMRVTIIGAGVAGLCCALECAVRGAQVEVIERNSALGAGNCSWFAGGMLAPWCERESAEPVVAELGEQSIAWWRQWHPETMCQGTLVVAHGRDRSELTRFAQRTERYRKLDREQLAELEPDLGGRFEQGLFFTEEAHLDPRAALSSLARQLGERGVPIRFGIDAAQWNMHGRQVIDCTGLSARVALPSLRGVKGEMLILRSHEMALSRPVRVLHPRWPLYVVPRGDGLFMVGATMIESDDTSRITARSMLELLSAAYALHPAFGEMEIVEIGTQARPAFPDNLPKVLRQDGRIYINGFYRHGFLLAPALGHLAASMLFNEGALELSNESFHQRRLA